MNVIKTIIYILLFVVLALYIGRFKISFNPFSIELGSWYNLIGYISSIIAVIFLSLGAYEEGYKKGTKDTVNLVQEALNEKIEKIRVEQDTVIINENHSEIK